jgi:hypothetical protein
LEPQAEWVRYKEKANFCEYFTLRGPVTAVPPTASQESQKSDNKGQKSRARVNNQNSTDQPQKKDKTKAAWDSLFKE